MRVFAPASPSERRRHHLQHSGIVYLMGSGLPRKLCPNVHDWGQVCMFQGKNRLDFRAFTSSCKQVCQSQPCASSSATAIFKVRSSMRKWTRPPSSRICFATNGGKGDNRNHDEGTQSTHLGGEQRGNPSPLYLDA